MKWYWLFLVALLVALGQLHAQAQDDQYVNIYNLIQEGDALNYTAQPSQALAKYREAQIELLRLQRQFPDWNPKVVNFRLNYLSARISALSALAPAPAAANQPPTRPTTKPGQPGKPEAANLENQITSLRAEVSQYQNTVRQDQARLRDYEAQLNQWKADRGLLEAKLKEALAVQPAAIDPRELARAEEKLKALQKETDLLKVSLEQEKSKPARAAVNAPALSQAQQALAEANRKLAEQTEKANGLAQDKKFLQNKLALLSPSTENAAALDSTRKALQEANRQLAQQKELAAKLTSERETLQSRVKSLSTDADAASALRTENALLKKQLADAKAATAPAGKATEASRQLAQAQAQIAVLRSDRDVLRLEKLALENRLKQLSSRTVTNPPALAPAKPDETPRIKELERQRDDLQKKLEAAAKALSDHKAQDAAAARITQMESQLAFLQARLDVFEAHSVPFTAEELALFAKPHPKPAQAEQKPSTESPPEPPARTVALAAEAQRYFSSGKLDKAEQTYVQVLSRDRTNVFALANLAAVQLERNRLADAEMNIKQAVALAPDDAYSLSILGFLKYRQQKYDESLDALSHAAKLDPQNARIQNYLGTTLAEKGLRGPAETAFRKAIEIDPKYGDAHINLAVIYISQQPPLVELARWHYQKALAAGHAPDPYLEKKLEIK